MFDSKNVTIDTINKLMKMFTNASYLKLDISDKRKCKWESFTQSKQRYPAICENLIIIIFIYLFIC